MQEWINVAYSVILVICVICVILINRQQPSREQQIMQMVIGFISITMIGYCFRIGADSLSALIVAQKLIYVGGCNLYYFMLLFYLSFCKIKLNPKVNAVLVGINVIMTVITFTFERHQLLYRSFDMIESKGFFVLDKNYGVLHTFYVAEVLLYCMVMLGISIWYIKVNRKNRNRQAVQLVLVILCPTASYILEKLLDPPFDIVPFGTVAGLLLMLYLMYIENIYDLENIARKFVFDSITSAIVVADAQNRYKGANTLAVSIFPELEDAVVNEDMIYVSERLQAMLEGNTEDLRSGEKLYAVEVRKILRENKILGKVIWLSDVTNQRKYTQFLENYQKQLQEEVNRKTLVLQCMQEEIILGFANIIESRDHVTGGHVKRTSGYVKILVNHMKDKSQFSEFSDEFYIKHICQAAPLHDIGKIGIPDIILNKTGKFEKQEFEVMKEHTTIGSEIIDRTLNSLEDKEYYELAKKMAGSHHEKWDGSGYPVGLRGEDIPICARIMAIADVFDALTSKRPYKKEFPIEEAFRIIEEGRGTQFDPDIVDIFMEAKEDIIQFHDANCD